MEILSIKSKQSKDKAVEALKKKRVVIFPTDTLYAIGADATDEKAVKRVFNIKSRKKDQPIAVMVSDLSMLTKYAVMDDKERKIAAELFPGPFTLLLKPEGLAKGLSSTGRVGFRMSPGFPAEMIKQFGAPVTCTSANLSGKDVCTTIKQCFYQFSEQVGFYANGGELISDPSTIVDPKKLTIVRSGEGLEKAEKALSLYGKVTKKQQGGKMADKTKTTIIKNIPYVPVAKNVFIISLLLSVILLGFKFFAFIVNAGYSIATAGGMPVIDPMSMLTRLLAILMKPIWLAVGAIIMVQLYNVLQDRIGPIEVALK